MYQTTLNKPAELDAALELVENTTKLVEIFNSHRPLLTASDCRMKQLGETRNYFGQWLSASEQHCFTLQTRFDLLCTIDGLKELFSKCLRQRQCINPGYINSDVIENHFCMVRGLFNGSSDHPNYFIYKSLQNAVILTQPVNLPSKRNSHSSYISPPNDLV